ncbi:25400_t:CDS:1, partial [Dentiscutata erythropus]
EISTTTYRSIYPPTHKDVHPLVETHTTYYISQPNRPYSSHRHPPTPSHGDTHPPPSQRHTHN